MDGALLAIQVRQVAGVWPVFGFEYEASCYWIAVQVASFLDKFLHRDDIEVVVAVVPEGSLR